MHSCHSFVIYLNLYNVLFILNNNQLKCFSNTFLQTLQVTTTTTTMTTEKSTFNTKPAATSVNVIKNITITPSTTSHGKY